MMRINMMEIVNSAVENGMAKAGLADKPENRIKILKGIHEEFVQNPEFGAGIQNDMLTYIENEVARLEEFGI